MATLRSLLDLPDVKRKLDIVNWRNQDSPAHEQAEGGHLTSEECAELIQANIKYYVRRKAHALENVAEETVDVLLMIDQMVRQLPEELLIKYMNEKLDRTIDRYHSPNSTYDDTKE